MPPRWHQGSSEAIETTHTTRAAAMATAHAAGGADPLAARQVLAASARALHDASTALALEWMSDEDRWGSGLGLEWFSHGVCSKILA
ncbi:CG43733 [Drosophila busckii]|uniref:CG43733 n=1 Tax=Drosophila busckii TaxID=30019 RepID=A0A0M4EG00_DROBS|nr:CG43733 [Drosophila busckii]